MRILQPPERIKEAPAQALRAVFAGVGQVLLMTERATRRTTAAPAAEAAVPAAATETAAAVPVTAAAGLPVPNYPGLPVASLRARLRGLDADQVRVLLDYERSHAGRADVVTMFERRIAKLEGTEDADSAAG